MATSTYILGSGPISDETVRLDTQHVYLRKLTRGLLPKDISDHVSKLPSPRIADVGTGTGVWLRDLATHLQSTSGLYGFDINTEQFPSSETLPANITFQSLDAMKPVPEEHVGSYDVVHARLFMYALKKGEWEVVARNLAGFLKPGGWLLWEETGYPSWVSLPPSPAINAIFDYDIRFAKEIGRDITHPVRLLAQVESAGLIDCTEKDHVDFELYATDEALRVFLKFMASAMKGIVLQGGMPGLESEEDIERLRKAAEDDLVSGRTLHGFQLKWVWGRKGQ